MLVKKVTMFSALMLMCATAFSADFPSRPVKIVVPFSAGGLADSLARGLGAELSKTWGKPVVVENKPGANTAIAANYVAKSAADGYTLLLANDSTMSVNQYLHKNLSYDPENDLRPVINIAASNQILVARPGSEITNLKQLVEAAKANPNKISYGSYGVGSTAHLSTETFASELGIKLNHIPYKGVSEVTAALLGSHIDVAMPSVTPVLGLIRDKKLQAIAIASKDRSSHLPDVPTFSESGLPGFETFGWFGIVAPKATDTSLVNRIAEDVSKVIVKPEFQEQYLNGVALELLDQDPEEFSAFLVGDQKKYSDRIQALGIQKE